MPPADSPASRSPGDRERWRARAWMWLGVASLLAVTAVSPLYQLVKAGVLYYENGPDEFSYLQYEFSLSTASATRPGQYLVSMLHQLGLSGGWINALLDTLVLVGFPLLMAALLRRLGWRPLQAAMGALMVVLVPSVVLQVNPLVQWLSDWNVRSGALYWFNMPGVHYSPFMRSPEPQFSLMLLAVAVLVALRWRRFWPVYAVLPMTYPFVTIPAAFVALACQLRARWPFARRSVGAPLLASGLAVMTACWAYYTLLVGPKLRLLVVASHLPLISFTGAIALGLYLALRHWIAEEQRFFALAVALSPWVASNQQLISGHVPQPDSFEQYVGCLAVAIVAAFALKDRPRLRMACLALGAGFFMSATYHTFRINQAYMIRLPMTPEIREALRTDAAHVVVNDPFLASLWGMVHPRQPSTALSFERTFVSTSDRYAPVYRCLKRQIAADYPGEFDLAFRLLDEAYAYGSQKYVMSHIYRKQTFAKLHDVDPAGCTEGEPAPLRYFFLIMNPYDPGRPIPAVK